DTGCAGSKRGFGKPADDGRFAEQLVGNGCQNAFRRLDDAHGILAGDELFEAAGKIAVATRKTRQDKSFLSMNEVAAVQLGGDMDREAAASKRFGGVTGVGSGGEKITAHCKEYGSRAVVHRPDSFYDIQSVMLRGTKGEPCFQRIQEFLFWFFPDAHRPIALDIAMTAHGTGPGAGFADTAFEKQEIGDLFDRVNRIGMLRKAHRPTNDDLLFVFQDGRGLADRGNGDAASLREIGQRSLLQVVDE